MEIRKTEKGGGTSRVSSGDGGKMTVARAIARTLASYGTEYYFCLTGGDHDLWLALDEQGIEIVNCRTEAAATYMADGYARVSGRPGFVYGQRGPGAANVAAAMADPYWALSPVVSLTTSIHFSARDRFQYQDVDTLPQYEPVTVWNRTLSSPPRAADMVRSAVRAATGPVPGPVHLEIPADMLAIECSDFETYAEDRAGLVGRSRIDPRPEEVAAVAERLRSARRPLILAGSGVVISGAAPELRQLAEALSIPVATTLGGKGALADDSPLAVGVVGRYSRRVANDVLADCDMVLAIGTRLGGLVTHGWTLPFREKALVQIDADPQVIGQNYRVDAAVLGDVRLSLSKLTESLADANGAPVARAWAAEVEERVRQWQIHADGLCAARPGDGIHPALALRELRRAMAPEDVLVADTGGIAAWAGTLFPISESGTFLRSCGSLGWALPAALGVALARPEPRTVSLIGDGGLLYFIGELETMIRKDMPAVIVVFNNRAFASEYHLLKNIWSKELPAVTDFGDVAFAQVAEGFGVRGLTVREPGELADAFAVAFAERRPILVDVRISKEAEAPAEHFRGTSKV